MLLWGNSMKMYVCQLFVIGVTAFMHALLQFAAVSMPYIFAGWADLPNSMPAL